MNKFIKVTYTSYGSDWYIKKTLHNLFEFDILSLDVETKGVYTKEQRVEAEQLLNTQVINEKQKLLSLIKNNSGLSFPSLINVTHFIFGTSESHSIILIITKSIQELYVWNWIKNYKGKFIIHNSLFDLKIMYHRIQKLPSNYEDTQLLVKTYINNSDVWKSKVGLKDLMSSYYNPDWALFDNYEPSNLKDKKFLEYAAIDGAATFKLWQLLKDKNEI